MENVDELAATYRPPSNKELRSPVPYKGHAVVAFIDLMGFTARLQETWGQEHGALEQLLAIKSGVEAIPTVRIMFDDGAAAASADVVHVSDSILIFSRVPTIQGQLRVWDAFTAVAVKATAAIRIAAEQGFGLRGAIEFGEVYWTGNDAIGPAYLNAVHLEKQAETARIVIGPEMARALPVGLLTSANNHLVAAEFLYDCGDGCFGLHPTPGLRPALEQIRFEAPPHLAYRYDEMISVARDVMPERLSAITLGRYRAAAKAAHILCQKKR